MSWIIYFFSLWTRSKSRQREKVVEVRQTDTNWQKRSAMAVAGTSGSWQLDPNSNSLSHSFWLIIFCTFSFLFCVLKQMLNLLCLYLWPQLLPEKKSETFFTLFRSWALKKWVKKVFSFAVSLVFDVWLWGEKIRAKMEKALTRFWILANPPSKTV